MSDPHPSATGSEAAVPDAVPAPRRSTAWRWWLVPLVTAGLVVALLLHARSGRGPEIVIVVPDAHGLRVGDAVRHRGMDVGMVDDLALGSGAGEVRIRARLDESARELAREGSRFWIERPILGAEGISGVDTILGGRYLAVIPGAGEPSSHFIGLPHPPLRSAELEGGLELVLESPRRAGLVAGAPVSYRQVAVGRVVGVQLASDGRGVLVHVVIAPRYAGLVRERSRFWSVSGLRIEAGLFDGLSLELDSLAALAQGGVAFATPEDHGGEVATGRRFRLHTAADEDWLRWAPALVVGEDLPGGAPLPRPERAAVTWTTGGLWSRDRRRAAWALPLPGAILAPADVLAPETPGGAQPVFEIGGRRFELRGADLRGGNGLALLSAAHGLPPWPSARLRAPQQPEDLVLVRGDAEALPVAAERLRPGDDPAIWRLTDGLMLDEAWHGSVAVSRRDGMVIGVMAVGEDAARIRTLPELVIGAVTEPAP